MLLDQCLLQGQGDPCEVQAEPRLPAEGQAGEIRASPQGQVAASSISPSSRLSWLQRLIMERGKGFEPLSSGWKPEAQAARPTPQCGVPAQIRTEVCR